MELIWPEVMTDFQIFMVGCIVGMIVIVVGGLFITYIFGD